MREFDAAGLVTDFVKQAILEPAEEHLETSFSELDSAKAVALDAIAERYMAFGLYDKARSLKQHAIDIFARTNGPDSRATLHTRIRMADILTMSNKLAEAVDAARATMDACRRVL